MGELLTKSLGGRQVGDVGEAVVIALVGDLLLIEITCQALPTVDVHLDLERKPALQTDMDETQFTIQIVEVIMQTFGAPAHHFQSLRRPIATHREGRTGFQRVQDTHQAFADLGFFGHLPGQFFFAVTVLGRHRRFKVAEWPTRLGGKFFCMLFDLLADPFNVGLEVFQQHPLTAQ